MQQLNDAIDHGDGEAEEYLPPRLERRGRRIGNHVESENYKRRAGHGHERHKMRRTRQVGANLALQGEADHPRGDERQSAGE